MGFFTNFFSSEPSSSVEVEQVKTMDLKDMMMMLDPDHANRVNAKYNFKKDAEEALRNPIVTKCLTAIVQAAQQPRWELYIGDVEVDVEPRPNDPRLGIWKFIQRPNDKQTLKQFIREYLYYMYLAGETFIEMFPDPISFKRGSGKLYIISPDRVSFQGDTYVVDGKRRVPIVNDDGTRTIIHIKDFALSGNRGQSPLQAAWSSILNHNQALKWNSSVLQNSAKLPLVAVMKSVAQGKGSGLTQQQLDDLNRDISRFATPEGRGKPLVMSGDWSFEELGMNNKDLEWLSGMESMARNIALAFNVDPVILSFAGDSTYNNKRESNAALFKQTALPKLEEMIEELTVWLKEYIPGDWHIDPNYDDVSSLEVERESLWGRQNEAASIMSINERRAMIGYEPVDGGDDIPGIAAAKEAEEDPKEDDETETEPKEVEEEE